MIQGPMPRSGGNTNCHGMQHEPKYGASQQAMLASALVLPANASESLPKATMLWHLSGSLMCHLNDSSRSSLG